MTDGNSHWSDTSEPSIKNSMLSSGPSGCRAELFVLLVLYIIPVSIIMIVISGLYYLTKHQAAIDEFVQDQFKHNPITSYVILFLSMTWWLILSWACILIQKHKDNRKKKKLRSY